MAMAKASLWKQWTKAQSSKLKKSSKLKVQKALPHLARPAEEFEARRLEFGHWSFS
jgi:hypothetical protein